jgi:hypothetical protein
VGPTIVRRVALRLQCGAVIGLCFAVQLRATIGQPVDSTGALLCFTFVAPFVHLLYQLSSCLTAENADQALGISA